MQKVFKIEFMSINQSGYSAEGKHGPSPLHHGAEGYNNQGRLHAILMGSRTR